MSLSYISCVAMLQGRRKINFYYIISENISFQLFYTYDGWQQPPQFHTHNAGITEENYKEVVCASVGQNMKILYRTLYRTAPCNIKTLLAM